MIAPDYTIRVDSGWAEKPSCR